jgi:hypothetical protein
MPYTDNISWFIAENNKKYRHLAKGRNVGKEHVFIYASFNEAVSSPVNAASNDKSPYEL